MQQQDKVIDVRGVLERNCTTTSVDELRSQGRSRVKVINAKQISALIEEAVARAVEARRGSASQDASGLIEASRAEFQKLVAEREQELREMRAAMETIERERESLRREVAQKQALEVTVSRAREELQRVLGSPALEDLENVLRGFTERERGEEAHRAEALERERDELRKRVRTLEARAEGAGAEAANGAAMSAILSELQKLKDSVERAPSGGGQQSTIDASKMMESFGDAMEKKLDKLGRKLGVGGGLDAGGGISFDGLFNAASTVESNLEQVEVKERESSGIQDAVARMKAMRLKAAKGE